MDDNNKDIQKKEEIALTERNWLMLKEIEKGKTIKDAYYAAGYKGKGENVPYEFYHRLKKKLEVVYEADNIDSLRLKIRAKKILDLPLEDKPVKAETHLKAIETLARLTEKEKKEAKSISPFIVFKADNVEITKGSKEITDPKIIEAEEIDGSRD